MNAEGMAFHSFYRTLAVLVPSRFRLGFFALPAAPALLEAIGHDRAATWTPLATDRVSESASDDAVVLGRPPLLAGKEGLAK